MNKKRYEKDLNADLPVEEHPFFAYLQEQLFASTLSLVVRLALVKQVLDSLVHRNIQPLPCRFEEHMRPVMIRLCSRVPCTWETDV